VVIAGFEPLDVMQSVLMLIRQINEGRHEVENEYTRVVTREGNRRRRRWSTRSSSCADQFRMARARRCSRQRAEDPRCYAAFDAEKRFAISPEKIARVKSCECPAILRGVKKPTDCKLFGTVCTPDNPDGLLHGVVGRRLRGLLDLWPLP
jgi:hydrogenase expression/formation protein HypD